MSLFPFQPFVHALLPIPASILSDSASRSTPPFLVFELIHTTRSLFLRPSWEGSSGARQAQSLCVSRNSSTGRQFRDQCLKKELPCDSL